MDSNDTVLYVSSAALFPATGTLLIDKEVLGYTSKTATSFTTSAALRGLVGSTASGHVIGSVVTTAQISTFNTSQKVIFSEAGSFNYQISRSVDKSSFTVSSAGMYNVQLSLQIASASTPQKIGMWIYNETTGANELYTARYSAAPAALSKHVGISTVSASYIFNFAAGDTFHVRWAPTSTPNESAPTDLAFLTSFSEVVSGPSPLGPAAILTVFKIA